MSAGRTCPLSHRAHNRSASTTGSPKKSSSSRLTSPPLRPLAGPAGHFRRGNPSGRNGPLGTNGPAWRHVISARTQVMVTPDQSSSRLGTTAPSACCPLGAGRLVLAGAGTFTYLWSHSGAHALPTSMAIERFRQEGGTNSSDPGAGPLPGVYSYIGAGTEKIWVPPQVPVRGPRHPRHRCRAPRRVHLVQTRLLGLPLAELGLLRSRRRARVTEQGRLLQLGIS